MRNKIEIIISIIAAISFSTVISFFIVPQDVLLFSGIFWIIPTVVTILSVLLMILSILYLFFSNIMTIYQDKSKMPKMLKILVNSGDDQGLIFDFLDYSKDIFYSLILLLGLYFSGIISFTYFFFINIYVGIFIEIVLISFILIKIYSAFDLFKDLLDSMKIQ